LHNNIVSSFRKGNEHELIKYLEAKLLQKQFDLIFLRINNQVCKQRRNFI